MVTLIYHAVVARLFSYQLQKRFAKFRLYSFRFFFGAGAGGSYWGLTMGLGSLIVRSIASFQLTVNVNAVVPCLCNFPYIIYIKPSRFVAVSV